MSEVASIYEVVDANGRHRVRGDEFEVKERGDVDRVVFKENGSVTYITWSIRTLLALGPVVGQGASDGEDGREGEKAEAVKIEETVEADGPAPADG
jgi:hypothetical protein